MNQFGRVPHDRTGLQRRILTDYFKDYNFSKVRMVAPYDGC